MCVFKASEYIHKVNSLYKFSDIRQDPPPPPPPSNEGKYTDCKMLAFRILIAFAPLIQLVSATTKNSQFTALARAANLTYSDHLLFHSPARSKLSCVELCALTECCVRFTFTGKRGAAGVCRGHSTTLLSSDQGTHTAGATTYMWTGLREPHGEEKNMIWFWGNRWQI